MEKLVVVCRCLVVYSTETTDILYLLGPISQWELSPGAGFTKGLRIRLSQRLKSESFVFAKSWT